MSMGDLYRKLEEYSHTDYYPYHMPGHKRRLYGQSISFAADRDITEIEGFDNLHDAKGILYQIQKKAAAVYGADESFYLINGSTSGILSAVSAAVSENGKLLMVRGCHKSAYHAAYLRHLEIKYLWTGQHPEFDCSLPASAGLVEEALAKDREIQAVLIVSPTYEGLIADVAQIAEVAHKRGIPLIVDEAHGAHLGFHPAWPPNSSRQGADIVVQSLHKTLPSLTQTAILHVNGTLINRQLLKRFLGIYQSSSPSYIFMAGMEEAIDIAAEGAETLFSVFLKNWQTMLRRLDACECIHILQDINMDIGKLVIADRTGSLSGRQLYEMLLDRYHLQMEMAAGKYVLAMFTIGDTAEGYERLTNALLEIDRECVLNREKTHKKEQQRAYESSDSEESHVEGCKKPENFTAPIQIYSLSEAWDKEVKEVLLSEAQEKIAGNFINLYPPGIPLVVPGERLTKDICRCLQRYIENGLNVQGITWRREEPCINIIV